MEDNTGQTGPQDDEVILRVTYNTFTFWFLSIFCLGLTTLGWYVVYVCVLRSAYLLALICVPGALGTLAVTIDGSLTKHILFYDNRLVKVWYFLGQRTIPYAKAKLCVNSGYRQWRYGDAGKSFRVWEIDDTGRVLWSQVYVGYCYPCVPGETRERVQTVLSYLLGLEDSSKFYEKSRSFVRDRLSREVLWSYQQKSL